MAVFVAFRLAVWVAGVGAPVGYRVISSGQPSNASMLWGFVKNLMSGDDWTDLTDAELSALLSEWSATDVYVATYATDIGLRKLQVRYSRAPAGGTVEDVAVTTHTFLKVSGGVPVATWVDPTDYAAVEAAFGTFWASIKADYQASVHLDQYRWYLDNDAVRLADHAPNPALRVTEVDVAGTGTGSALPPQTAVSVTEITAARLSWGRFYLPAPNVNSINASGRHVDPALLAGKVITLYNSCRSAGLIPVVFAPGLPERSSAAAKRTALATGPGTAPALDIPARAAVVYEVTHVQVDDLFDTIRSRRWDSPTIRSKTAVA